MSPGKLAVWLVLICSVCTMAQDSLNIRQIGRVLYDWDSIYDVEQQGGYAFCAADWSGLIIVDVWDPAHCFVVGHCDLPGYVRGIEISGTYAYLCGNLGLSILDISDVTEPYVTGTCPLPGAGTDISLSGSYAFISGGYTGLHIVNAMDPSAPVEIGSCAISGYSRGVIAGVNLTYVVGDGLHIVDVSDLDAPVEIGQCDNTSIYYNIVPVGGYAYVSGFARRVVWIDLTDPAAPVQAGSLVLPGIVSGVEYNSGRLYVMVEDYDLRIFRVVADGSLEEWGSCATPQHAERIHYSMPYLLTAGGDEGLRILEVRIPSLAREIGHFDPGYCTRVNLAGNHAYLCQESGGLRILNVAQPEAPAEVAQVQFGEWTEAATVSGDYAYVCQFEDSLSVIDVHDPANPHVESAIESRSYLHDVAVQGNYAYIASSSLRIAECSNPAALVEIAVLPLPSAANRAVVSDNRVYLPCYGLGLHIVDVENPADPRHISYSLFDGPALDVAVSGPYAYVACGAAGMSVLDVTTPQTPLELGTLDTPGSAVAIALSGHYALIADDSGGVRVVDVAIPSAPVESGYYRTGRQALDIAVSGALAYVADGYDFLVLDCSAALKTPGRPEIPPGEFRMSPAYPNPFNPVTTIELDFGTSVNGSVIVCDILGREVRQLDAGRFDAGHHRYRFDGSGLASGTYVVRAECGEFRTAQTIQLIK